MADLTELNFFPRQDFFDLTKEMSSCAAQLLKKYFKTKKILPGKIRPQWGGSRLCSSVLLSPDPGRAHDGPVPGSAGKAGGAVEVGADGGAVMRSCSLDKLDY